MKAVGWVLRLRLPTNARLLVGILCYERIVSTFRCLIQRSTNNKDRSRTFRSTKNEEITLPWVGYCDTLPCWVGHCDTNLADLIVESGRNKLIIKIIPKCIQSQANEDNDDDDEENYKQRSSLTAATKEVEGEKESTNEQKQPTIKDCLLLHYMEQPISISTTWRWLQRLGYCHDL
jgi:hypothetical protein